MFNPDIDSKTLTNLGNQLCPHQKINLRRV